MNKKLINIAILVVLLIGSQKSEAQNLFEKIDFDPVTLNAKAKSRIGYMKSHKYYKDLQFIRIANINQIRQAQILNMRINNKVFVSEKGNITEHDGNKYTFSANFRNEGYAMLTVNEQNNITGLIQIGAEKYLIDFLENGMHYIVSVDVSELPPEAPALIDTSDSDSTSNSSGKNILAKSNSAVVVDVLVVYTATARVNYPSIESWIDQMFIQSNQSFVNSNMNLSWNKAHTMELYYPETGDAETDLAAFRDPNNGWLGTSHYARWLYGADLCIILVSNSNYGGLATIKADPGSAFALATVAAAYTNFTFAHELGHLSDARHNVADSNPLYAFARNHGWRELAGANPFRTIMAYPVNASTGWPQRVNYWSNPFIDYFGYDMGNQLTGKNYKAVYEYSAVIAGWHSPQPPQGPFAPTNFTVTPVNSHPYLSWTPSVGAGSYTIKRRKGTAGQLVTLVTGHIPINYTDTDVWTDAGGQNTYYYYVYAVNSHGSSSAAGGSIVGGELDKTDSVIPNEFAMSSNYPNPFNPTTTIKYQLPKSVKVTLKIYNISGQEVATLVNEVKGPGYHAVNFDGSSLASGIYIYRITAGNYSESRRMVLIK